MDIIEGMVDLELEADLHAGGVGEGGGGGVRGGVSLSSSFVEFEYADVHELGLLRQRLRKSQENFRRERSRYRRLVKEAFAAMYGDGDAAAAAAAASPSPGGVGGVGGEGCLHIAGWPRSPTTATPRTSRPCSFGLLPLCSGRALCAWCYPK